MTVRKSQIKATAKYNQKNYDVVSVRIKKGKKDKYKQLADSKGVSFAQLVQSVLDEECEKAGLAGKVWQYFTVVPDFKSTGITDGKRTFAWPCIIRAINTTDVMEVTVEHLEPELIDHLARRITTEVPGINRVLYDFTPKPPATVEYE